MGQCSCGGCCGYSSQRENVADDYATAHTGPRAPLLMPAEPRAASSDDERALLRACSEGDAAQVARLLSLGVYPHVFDADSGYSALHCACDNARHTHSESDDGERLVRDESAAEEITALLLRYGVDANAKARNGRTPLHLCAAHCFERVVRVLVLFGHARASMYVEDCDGHFPVDLVDERVDVDRAMSLQHLFLQLQFAPDSDEDD